ncbi:MAG: hypothetical protein P8O70_20570 [SAR324 cluster bacterium]|nr:hypothetical protein [SAR324 cluster bacterium]
MKTILLSLVIFLAFFSVEERTYASDCPKMELPTSFLGIFLTTTMLPIGTTIAAGRSSNTSGCGSSEPSDSFYRPKAARLKLFFEEAGESLAEEIATGEVGPYLQVITHLSECREEGSPFILNHLRIQYSKYFNQNFQPEKIAQAVYELSESPSMRQFCQAEQKLAFLSPTEQLQFQNSYR